MIFGKIVRYKIVRMDDGVGRQEGVSLLSLYAWMMELVGRKVYLC